MIIKHLVEEATSELMKQEVSVGIRFDGDSFDELVKVWFDETVSRWYIGEVEEWASEGWS